MRVSNPETIATMTPTTHPAPKRTKKAKAVTGRVMYVRAGTLERGGFDTVFYRDRFNEDVAVLILPLNDINALVEAGASAIYRKEYGDGKKMAWWNTESEADKEEYRVHVRAVLTALGVPAKRATKGKAK